MGRLRELRRERESVFRKTTAHAKTLRQLMDWSKEEALQNYERTKASFKEKIEEVKAILDEIPLLSDDKKRLLKSKFERLQETLSKGRAYSKAAFEKERVEIRQAIDDLDAALPKDMGFLDTLLGPMWDEFDAELEELILVFHKEFDKGRGRFKEEKKELVKELHEFRRKIDEKRNSGEQRAEELRRELQSDLVIVRHQLYLLINELS